MANNTTFGTRMDHDKNHPFLHKRTRSDSPLIQNNVTNLSVEEQTILREESQEDLKCWKCQGTGVCERRHQKKTRRQQSKQGFQPKSCPVCQGSGKRKASLRSQEIAKQPGKIIPLRGKDGRFAGVPAYHRLDKNENPNNLVNYGELLAALGCGDWRIFQLANGHKLTVDDFLCAWYAAKEMRRRGYGLVQEGAYGQILYVDPSKSKSNKIFHHADIGCGCGSVLMTLAWAFPQVIRSHGVEAQEVSFGLCRRGLLFNLGQDGSSPNHTVQLTHQDLRSWDGGPIQLFDLITGTPPYFPEDRFVASENHVQKVRCRIPTRGAAADYVAAAARLIKTNGVICIAETARKEGEDGMTHAIREYGLKVLKRLDVITRAGLPPRFSCWLLTKPESRPETFCSDFVIETLTIRGEDLNRTLEYVDAMESMGWVDFENTRKKLSSQTSQA